MDLNSILEKTKAKSEKIKKRRDPVNIAIDDRPYDIAEDIIDQKETACKQTANRLQTDSKLAANQLKTDCKVSAEVAAYPLQTDLKPVANNLQSNFKTDCKISFLELVTLQKELMILFYLDCKKNASRVTSPITLEYLFYQTSAPIKSLKSAIYRLEGKLLILRYQFKNGRGGWTRYEVPEYIYKQMYQLETDCKLTSNQLQSDFKPAAKLTAIENHYSSSNFITTIEEENQKIDINPLEHIGLTRKHLSHLKNCPDEIIQESINHFAFGLKNNKRVGEYKEPLNVFIGTLRKGIPWVEANYVSQQEIAMKQLSEIKKREQERIAKLEEEMLNLEFDSWRMNLSEVEIVEICASRGRIPQDVAMKLHFKETLWPSIKNKIQESL